MTVNEMVAEMTKVLDEFEAALDPQAAEDSSVIDGLMLSRRKMGKVNPDMPTTAKAELATVQRWMLELASDAAYATGGKLDEANAAKAQMQALLNGIY